MKRSYSLATSERLLRALIVLNWVYGLLILVLLIASVVAEAQVMGALGADPGPGNAQRIAGMRVIAAIGILGVPLVHYGLKQLLAIVRSVSEDDPFVVRNAARLRSIGWCLVGLELLHLGVGAVAAIASSATAPLDIGWSFSVTRWLAALLLFVLAQVFERGARMRDDLEGTI